MKNPDAALLARQRRVQHFPRHETAIRRKDQHHNAELAALRLVNGDGIGQLQIRLAVFGESRPRKRIIAVVASGKLDLRKGGLAPGPLHLANDHADLAVREEFPLPLLFRGVDVRLPLVVANTNDLVAIDDLFGPPGLDESHPVAVGRNVVRFNRVAQPFCAQAITRVRIPSGTSVTVT